MELAGHPSGSPPHEGGQTQRRSARRTGLERTGGPPSLCPHRGRRRHRRTAYPSKGVDGVIIPPGRDQRVLFRPGLHPRRRRGISLPHEQRRRRHGNAAEHDLSNNAPRRTETLRPRPTARPRGMTSRSTSRSCSSSADLDEGTVSSLDIEQSRPLYTSRMRCPKTFTTSVLLRYVTLWGSTRKGGRARAARGGIMAVYEAEERLEADVRGSSRSPSRTAARA